MEIIKISVAVIVVGVIAFFLGRWTAPTPPVPSPPVAKTTDQVVDFDPTPPSDPPPTVDIPPAPAPSTNTPSQNPQEQIRNKIRIEFWMLYASGDRTGMGKWCVLYKKYKMYNANSYVRFLHAITTNRKSFEKFKELEILPATEHNDDGLSKLNKSITNTNNHHKNKYYEIH